MVGLIGAFVFTVWVSERLKHVTTTDDEYVVSHYLLCSRLEM
jgi:hypothetical protein